MVLPGLSIDRRSFLRGATSFALGLQHVVRGQTPIERGRFSGEQVPLLLSRLLKLVNEERAQMSLSQLELDELACRVATEHAEDMLSHRFVSHWGSDGRKPYHRYSFAGGSDAVQENISAAENIQSLAPYSVINDFLEMHGSMIQETPPNDGHRRTILDPWHTHVGFGLAFAGHTLRLDELFLARYLRIDPLPREIKLKSKALITGSLLNPKHFLHEVDIYFEQFPTPPDAAWLSTIRSVSLPDDLIRLRPKAPEGTTYSDGRSGDYEWTRDGRFRVPLKLFKNLPGIYTVVFWVRTNPADKAFPGAEICLRCR